MNTKKTRQLGEGNYIAAEDIQHIIYDSDEEYSREISHDEQVETREKYNNGRGLKPGSGSHSETKSSKYCGRLYDSLDIWYGKPKGNKLNNSSSNVNEKKTILNSLDSNAERASSIHLKNTKQNSGDKLSELNETDNSKECLFSNARDENLKGLTKDNTSLTSGRKRVSDQDLANVNFSKKSKIQVDKNMSNIPNYNSLQVELELDNNCKNEVNERRNIEAIVNELELLNRKVKESAKKYTSPVVWGTPIVKQCSEKWDPHYIPQIMMERYQKHFEVSPSSSSSFQSKNFETNSEVCDSHDKQLIEFKGNRNADKEDEEGCEVDCYNEPPNSDIQMDEVLNRFDPEAQGVASLKSRIHNRQQEERISDDSFPIEESPKKQQPSKSNKGKNCNDPSSKYQNEDNLDSNKNFEKYNIKDLDNTITSPASIETHPEDKASGGTTQITEEEQVVCPICNNKFDIEKIVTHASHCATETFRD